MSTIKKTAYTIGNSTIEFVQPGIKRDFWFSEDAHTVEEWDEVQNSVRQCKTFNYFIDQNMQSTTAYRLLSCMDDRSYTLYSFEGKSFIQAVHRLDDPSWSGAHELTSDEREQLRTACEAEQAKFEKRLRTYLKRYGLSKCHFSTYWANR